jgi:hypothetical protein
MPDPRNPLAMMDREAWDCREATGDPEAIYLVPSYVTATRGKTRSGGASGGGGGGQAAETRTVREITKSLPGQVSGGAGNDAYFGTGSSTAGGRGDNPVGRQIVQELGEVVGELRTLNRKVGRDDGGMGLRRDRLV